MWYLDRVQTSKARVPGSNSEGNAEVVPNSVKVSCARKVPTFRLDAA